jgi:hypothetical protein
MILAIDPGSNESGFVLLKDNLSVYDKGKVKNEKLLDEVMYDYLADEYKEDMHVVIEMVASYGMAVGKEVFETCVWIGRFYQQAYHLGYNPQLIYRKDEKMNLCNSMKAKDSNIIQALIDRFAPNTPNKGKGTKKEQGWFYGFSKDMWQAYAVGVTYYDMYLNKQEATNDK